MFLFWCNLVTRMPNTIRNSLEKEFKYAVVWVLLLLDCRIFKSKFAFLVYRSRQHANAMIFWLAQTQPNKRVRLSIKIVSANYAMRCREIPTHLFHISSQFSPINKSQPSVTSFRFVCSIFIFANSKSLPCFVALVAVVAVLRGW